MSWLGIEGQDHLVEQFRTALAQNRLASSFLFVGSEGIGKRTFALKLSQAMLCQTTPPEELNPCGECSGCKQVLSGNHPDVTVVSKPPEKSALPLSLLIGSKEKRMREGLCHEISLKPFLGGYKIGIIDDADALNVEGANCLLKTLEEPPPHSLLILISTSPDRQLPTIRSRCQILRFAPLTEETIAHLLITNEIVADDQEAKRLAKYSEGSLSRAKELSDPELWKFRQQLLNHLANPQSSAAAFAIDLIAFVEAAGKEAIERRNRMRQLVVFAVEFYRQTILANNVSMHETDNVLATIVQRAIDAWKFDSDELAGKAIERSLETLVHIDRNLHQQTLLETWLDDLSKITEGRLVGK